MALDLAALTPRQRWDAACWFWDRAEIFPEGGAAWRDLRNLGNRYLGLPDEPAPVPTETRLRRVWQRLAVAIAGRTAPGIEGAAREEPAC